MPTQERDSFSKQIEPHFDRLFRLAYRLTGSRSDAEDLLQDVMIQLYEQRDALAAVTDLSPWLSRVLYTRFVDNHRARQRRPLTLVGDDEDALGVTDTTDPAAMASAGENAARLERALARLSDDHRVLVLMHDAEGYTLAEIADITDTPVGTLKSRLSRARARIRELLWDVSEAPDAAAAQPASAQQAAVKKMEPFSAPRRVGG
ncbi:MAG: RNA polymerase sigma factor [Gammaproteobacteria bacterium]